jgi:hypothetical protein
LSANIYGANYYRTSVRGLGNISEELAGGLSGKNIFWIWRRSEDVFKYRSTGRQVPGECTHCVYFGRWW